MCFVYSSQCVFVYWVDRYIGLPISKTEMLIIRGWLKIAIEKLEVKHNLKNHSLHQFVHLSRNKKFEKAALLAMTAHDWNYVISSSGLNLKASALAPLLEPFCYDSAVWHAYYNSNLFFLVFSNKKLKPDFSLGSLCVPHFANLCLILPAIVSKSILHVWWKNLNLLSVWKRWFK